MDLIEILVYIYAGLFGLTFCILIGLYVWMYKLSKLVKKNGKKNPYDAFVGTEHHSPNHNDNGNVNTSPNVQQQKPPEQLLATDLYKDYKMRRAQQKDNDATSLTSRNTRGEENLQRYVNVRPSALHGYKRAESENGNGRHRDAYENNNQRGNPINSKLNSYDDKSNQHHHQQQQQQQPQSMRDMIRGAKLVNRRYNQFD